MASVEHTLLFLLTAKVDSAFGSGFSTAKSALADMQKQIRDNKNTIGKIDEYEKAVAALNKMESATGTSSEKIEAQRAKVETLGAELRGLGVNLEDPAGEQARLTAATEATAAAMTAWQEKVNTVTNVARIFSSLSMMAGEALKPINAITGALEASVQTASGFEYTMSAVSAISGASRTESAALSDVAKEMGATTVFTAQQSAEALQTMALAGWDAQDMIAGLPAVIKLAAASGEDLTEVTSILSDGMHAFGLEGTASTVKFADVLTKAATSSNTTVGLLGQSLSYVETTAGNMGYSIEDVSVALAAMANNALKGGVSGSALNTMLTRMSGANATARKEMEALGLSMYDSEGQAKPLLQFLEELRGAFQGFGEDSQSAQIAAYKLAGMRGMRGLLALVNSSDEAWQSLVDDVYSYAGAADMISNQRLDNYTGQVTLLKSAQEALQTSIGEALLPVATDGAEALTWFTQGLNDAVQAAPELVVGVAAGAYEIKGLLSVIQAVSGPLMSFSMLLNAMPADKVEMMLGAAATGGKIAAATILLTILGAAMVAAAKGNEESQELLATTESLIDSYEREVEALETELGAYEERRASAAELIQQLDMLMQQDNENGEQTQTIVNTVEALNELLPGLGLEYDELTGKLNKTTAEMMAFNNAMGYEEYQTTKSVLQLRREELEALQKQLETAKQAQDDYYEENLDDMNRDAGVAYAATTAPGGVYVGNIFEVLKRYGTGRNIDKANEEAQEAIDDAAAQVEALEAELRQYAADRIAETGLEGLSEDDWLAYAEALEPLVEAYGEAYQAAYDSVTGQFSLWDEAGQYLNTFGESYQNAFDQAQKAYRDMFSLWDEVSWTAPEDRITFGGMQENQADQFTFWTTYRDNIQALQNSGIDLSGIWDQLTSGSMDAYDAVQAMVDALNSGDTTGLQAYIDKYHEIEAAQDEVAAAAAETHAVTLEQLQQNVDSQITAWEEYQSNLNTLSANFDLTPLNGQFDGSTAAMELAAALMQAYSTEGAGAVQEFLDSTASLSEAQGSVSSTLAGLDEEVQQAVQNMADALGPEAFAGKREVLETVAADVLAGWVQGIEGGEDMAAPLQSGITTAMEAAATAAGTHSPSTITTEIGQNVDQGFINGVQAMQGAIMSIMSSTASQAVTTFGSGLSYSSFYSYGVSAMQGAIAGINAMRGALVAAAAAAGTAAANAYRAAQNINSPSKLFEWFSEMDMLGAIQGIERNQDDVSAAMAEAAQENAAAYLSGGTASSITSVTAVDPLLMQAMDSMSAQAAQPMQAMMAPVASGGGATIQLTYSPQINAGSGTDATGIRRILDEDKDSLVNFLEDWANEREINQRRGTY